jgi:hypothetical protein
MNILDFLKAWEWLPSREGSRHALASNSEKRRWIERGSVEVNGQKAALDSPWPSQSDSVVVHPKGKHRTTLQ